MKKIKNLLVLTLTAFLFSSLYAQKENSELQITNKLRILDEPSTMSLKFDYAENQGIYDRPTFDEFIKCTTTEIDSNLAQQLQIVLDNAIIEYDIKGLSAAISVPNGDIWKGASGISHDTVELTTDMLFGIASITKTFMATIIMQLYEADSLKLSDSIYKWLPPFDNIDSTVTIRQLMNHTSGIYSYNTHPAFVDSTFVPGSRIWTPEEILETFVLSPLFPPGTDWEYCNTNYILLGMIIEEITGNEVVLELHNRLTIPLELNSTFLFPDEGYEGVRSNVWMPSGGDIIDVTELIDTTMFSAAWTAAALLSTAEDIVKWSKGLNEGEVLNDTTLALMREPAPYSGGIYGLGTFIEPLNSQPIYGHNGHMVYWSRVYYVPDDSLSISIISNQRYAPMYDIWHELYNAYMDYVPSGPCLPDGITFTTQAEIDNFQINHPNCTEIEGDVTISGDSITNLNGLSVLTSVGGSLKIIFTDSLINLAGLDNVTYIGGELYLYFNSITSLTGLDNVTFIGGDIFIRSNHVITSLIGLNNVTSIGGNLEIRGNNSLTNLMGLDNLDSIGGSIKIGGNDSLTSFAGLENLTSIGGSLSIGYIYSFGSPIGNPSLLNLTGLEGLTSIGEDLEIGGNNTLTSIASLENLTSVGGSVSIGIPGPGQGQTIGNDALLSLTGLENITSIESIGIGSNHALTSLTGLENITSIGGTVSIAKNATLASLTGLDNLNSIIGSLFIWGNDTMISLTGLESLTSIGEDLFIGGGGYLEGNPNLTSVTGLEGLTSIGGSLWIGDNDALTSLTGLDNVTFIGGDLKIGWYDGWYGVYIGNPALSSCEVQSVCDYLANPNGTISIVANAPGCNSQNEVEEACWTSVEEVNEAENHSIYPNPVTDFASFSSNEITSFELYDMMGSLIIRRNSNTFNMSNLNPGIYFVIGLDKYKNALYQGKVVKK